MVTRTGILLAFAFAWSQSPILADGRCSISQIRIDNNIERRIAPGEPVSLVFHVDAQCEGFNERAPDERELQAMIGRDLSQHVELDGVAFTNRLPRGMLNDVVLLEPKPLSPAPLPATPERTQFTFAYVGRIFLVNSKRDQRLALDTPGAHTLLFGKIDEVQSITSFVVDTPTPAEQAVIERLYADELLLPLANCYDCSQYEEDQLRQLTPILAMARGTRYEKYVSVAVGALSMCQTRRDWMETLDTTPQRTPADRRAYEERLLTLAKFFEHVKDSRVDSEFDLLALSNLSAIELLLAKKAASPSERDTHLAAANQLQARLARSPFASARWAKEIDLHTKTSESIRASRPPTD
jgi:hypothetical protein